MDDPCSDWVAYKVYTPHSDIEKNFREYQILKNRRFRNEQENGRNIYRVLDTGNSSPCDIEKKPKVEDEENFTHKSFKFRDKTCRDRKKTDIVIKRKSFEPEYNAVFCDSNDVEPDIPEIEAVPKKRKETCKATCMEDTAINLTPTAEQKLNFVSHRPLV